MSQPIGTVIYRMSKNSQGGHCIKAMCIPPGDHPSHMHSKKKSIPDAEILLQNATGIKMHCSLSDPHDVVEGSKDFWLPIGATEELRIKTYVGGGTPCDEANPNGAKCWGLEIRHFGMLDANTRIEPCEHISPRGDHTEIVVEC